MVSHEAIQAFLNERFPNRVATNSIYDRDDDGEENLVGFRVRQSDGATTTVIVQGESIVDGAGYIIATESGVITTPGNAQLMRTVSHSFQVRGQVAA